MVRAARLQVGISLSARPGSLWPIFRKTHAKGLSEAAGELISVSLGVGVSGTYDWLYTGSSSAGTIAIAGGHLTGLIGILGYGAGSMGSATVSSGTWSNSALAVGYSGTGVLNINGGYVSSGASYLGYGEGSMGTATVTSGTWINSYELYVGWSGKGILNVNGGYISNSEGIIGYSNGSSSTANVTSGTWSNSSDLFVGRSGTGVLNVNGGYVSNSAGHLGHNEGSSGTATVTSGTWSNSNELTVGWSGDGVLNVNGGYVSNSAGCLGRNEGTSGTATVTSGTWSNSDDLTIGNSGTGVLNVSGGLVNVTETTIIGNTATGVGSITLSGSSGNQGVLRSSQIREGSGRDTLDINGGILQAGANHNDFLSGFEIGDVMIGAEGAFIDTNGFDITIAAWMDGSGTLIKQGEGTLTLSNINSYSGGTIVTTGTLVVGSGGRGSIDNFFSHIIVGYSSGDSGSQVLSNYARDTARCSLSPGLGMPVTDWGLTEWMSPPTPYGRCSTTTANSPSFPNREVVRSSQWELWFS
jgi:fibronectin-binding autotransporter adhesin